MMHSALWAAALLASRALGVVGGNVGDAQLLAADFTAPQRADFRGVSAVRHGFDFMAEEVYRGRTPELAQQSIARMRDARLAAARTWYSADWVMERGWGAGLNFSTPRFEQWCEWLAATQAAGVDVVVTAGWWFTQNACAIGPPANCTPSDASLAVYSDWISQTAAELKRRGFSHASTFLLFTEPLSYESGIVPTGWNQTSYYLYAVRFLHNYMVARGTRSLVRFLAPNGDADVAGVAACVAGLADIIDIWSSHDYSKPTYAAWLATFEAYTNITSRSAAAGRRAFWADEGGLNGEANRNASDYGTYLALWQAALMNAGGSNSFLWLWEDQYYVWPLENATNSDSFDNGLHRWGLSYWLPDSADVRPAWYAFTILTRFLRAPAAAAAEALATATVTGVGGGGAVIVAAVAGLPGGAAPGYRAFLLINEGATQASVAVAVSGGSAEPLRRVSYNPAAPPRNGATLVPPSGSPWPDSLQWLNDTLAPREVAMWVSASGL